MRVSPGDIIINTFHRETFNKLAREFFSRKSHETGVYYPWTDETRDHIYADKINELLRGIRYVGSSYYIPPDVQKGDLITAAFINQLLQAMEG